MKLNIHDRMTFGQILPQQGNKIEQMIVRDIIKKTELSQEDHKKADIQVIPGAEGKMSMLYLPENDFEKEVTFTEIELKLITVEIGKMDKQGKIDQSTLSLVLKFDDEKKVEEDKEDDEEVMDDTQ